MSYGLAVWDAAGVQQIDFDTRLTRLLGIVTNPASSGSISDPGFSTGDLWWNFVYDRLTQSGQLNGFITVTKSGNTISWNYNSPNLNPCYLMYGVY